MELTVSEKLHIYRRRKWWHKLYCMVLYLFAAIGLTLFFIIGVMSTNKLEENQAYRKQMAQLSVMAEQDSLPDNCVRTEQLGSPEEFISAQLSANLQLLDSLGMYDNVRGCDIRITVAPTKELGIRYVTSQWEWFLKCDCKEPDEFNMVIVCVDPITKEARVASSHEVVAQARIP